MMSIVNSVCCLAFVYGLFEKGLGVPFPPGRLFAWLGYPDYSCTNDARGPSTNDRDRGQRVAAGRPGRWGAGGPVPGASCRGHPGPEWERLAGHRSTGPRGQRPLTDPAGPRCHALD
jgi:hypothetical protein